MSTENSLFSSGNDSDSVESKENGAPAASKPLPTGAAVGGGGGGGGGGLFDDEDEDDDFFSSKSLKKSDSGKCEETLFGAKVQVQVGSSPLKLRLWFSSFSAGQEKPKPKKSILFDEDDEDGDIFSEKYKASTPAQSKKEAVEEPVKHPEKKVKTDIHMRLNMMVCSVNCIFGVFLHRIFGLC